MSSKFLLATLALTCAAFAQPGPAAPDAAGAASATAPPSAAVTPAKPSEPAELEGVVVNDATGEPLRRAHVVLHPLETGLSATGADADEEGHFLLRGIPKGLYSLSADRDGFLTSSQPLNAGRRMPPSFEVQPGQKISGLLFRLRPWAVIFGHVRYAGGDFGIGIRVELFRTDHIRGRRAYSLAATTVTNDRGEYRVYGLAPGAYIVAAEYDPPPTQNYRAQPTVDAEGHVLPPEGYITTFYPNTELMSQAVPVRLKYGEEIGTIDLSLRLARKLTIRGRILDATTGSTITSANVTLARADQSGQGTMATNARPSFDAEGNYVIPDVAPGSYALSVRAAGEDGQILTGHALLVVGSDDVDSFDVIAAPAEPWPGRIVTEGSGVFQPGASVRVTLEPRDVTAQSCTTSAAPDKDSGQLTFDCDVDRDQVYDVFADNLPDDFYLSAVRVGGADVRTVGLPGSVVSKTPFDVVLNSQGGRVSGVIAGADNALWAGASLALIPDPPARRWQDYRFVSADASGRFLFRGVAPGPYVLVGWLDQAPCDVYDPDGLDLCRAAGTPVTVTASTEQSVVFTVHSPAQP